MDRRRLTRPPSAGPAPIPWRWTGTVLVVCMLALAGCSGRAKSTARAATASASRAGPTGTLSIVAGENFWGSIVAQLAGKAGGVTSVVSDPNADPHNYESSSDDARAFAGADYVVLNGAGYDSWADKLLSGNPNPKRKVTVVADVLGKKEGDNPHFWYRPDYVTTVTDRVESDLKVLDPADSAYFDAQRAVFEQASKQYRNRLATIKARFAGTPVGATESIFAYLASFLELDLLSPPAFMQAVAEGNDPPAATVGQFQDQVSRAEIKVLVYNRQTATAVTSNVKRLAGQHHIPTVGITETIQPADATFEQWQDSELQNLEKALSLVVASGPGTSTSGPDQQRGNHP